MNNKQAYRLGNFSKKHPLIFLLAAILTLFLWFFAIYVLWNELEILFSSNWILLNLGLILSLLPMTLCLGYVILAARKKTFWKHITKKSGSNRHPFLATGFLLTVVPFLLCWQSLTIYRLTTDLIGNPAVVTGNCSLSRQVKDKVKYGRYIAESIHVNDGKGMSITLAISGDMFMQHAASLTAPDTFRLYGNDSRRPVDYKCRSELVAVEYLVGTKRVISIKDISGPSVDESNNLCVPVCIRIENN
jgi:hypothetical protein